MADRADKILALELLDGVAYSEEFDGVAYSEEYRHRVQSTLPSGVIASEKFWSELEVTVDTFLLRERQRLHRPPLAERERCQRIEGLISTLGEGPTNALV